NAANPEGLLRSLASLPEALAPTATRLRKAFPGGARRDLSAAADWRGAVMRVARGHQPGRRLGSWQMLGRIAGRSGGVLAGVVGALAAMAMLQPAHAIPSPDLAVNLFSSVAQLIGLATVVGGIFAVG